MAMPAVLRQVAMAGGDMPYAFGLVILLSLLNLLTVPLWSALLLPVRIGIAPGQMLSVLILNLLVPFTIGSLLQLRFPERAQVWSAWEFRLGSLLLPIAAITLLIRHRMVISAVWGTAALATSVVISLLAAGIGSLAGGREAGMRRSLALITTGRAVAPALLLAVSAAPYEPRVAIGVVAMAVASVLVRLALALYWRRSRPPIAMAEPANERRAA